MSRAHAAPLATFAGGLAGLGGVLLAMSMPVAACASFGATASAEDGGLEAAVDAPADAGIPNCTDLTAGPGDYTSWMHGGQTSSGTAGLKVSYPVGAKQVDAAWVRTFVVPGATIATVRIDATIELPAVLPTAPPAPPWFAGFAALSRGDVSAVAKAPFIELALSDQEMTLASFDANVFAASGATMPLATQTIGTLSPGSHSVSVAFDVSWATTSTVNVRAQLGQDTVTLVPEAGLASAPTDPWTLYLGGYAEAQPLISIVYTRACITLR